MAVAGEDGLIVQYIDTQGDLRETEQLIFYNGILMGGYMFTKAKANQAISLPDNLFRSAVLHSITASTQFSMQNMIDLGKQLQFQFSEMKIPAIMNEISEVLFDAGFIKETIPGIYLLASMDLVELHFTSKCRLRKIL